MGEGVFRNKPCPCKSGKKYKDCHQKRGVKYDDLKKGITLKEAIKRNQPKLCLLKESGGCNKIIKAHNIQNNRILNQIAVNGDVVIIGFNPEKMNVNSPGVGFEKKGRGSATTFTGLCGKHDNEIFQPIDDDIYTPGNQEQEFLYALRAFLFERYKKEGVAKLVSDMMENEFSNSKNLEGVLLGNINALHYMQHYLQVFLSSLKTKDYQNIKSFTVEFNDEYLLAISSTFGLEYNIDGSRVQDISDLSQRVKALFLTLFPQGNKTYVIFSYLKEDEKFFKTFTEQFLSLPTNNQQKILNNLLMGYVENFVISPAIHNQLTNQQIQTFINENLSLMSRKKNDADLSREPAINFFHK